MKAIMTVETVKTRKHESAKELPASGGRFGMVA